MEFYYDCCTCAFRHREAGVVVVYDDTKMWCSRHSVLLPTGPGSKDVICSNYEPRDPRATEWQSVIAKFPEGELWTFELYRPSRKFAVIAELPKVDPKTGEVVEV